mgnify:CR=1 FL=1
MAVTESSDLAQDNGLVLRIEENAEDEEWVFRDVQSVYTPYLNRALPVRSIWSWSRDGRDPRGGDHPDFSAILGQTEFENLVSMRSNSARILISENESLRAAIERILDLVEEEVQKK